MGMWKPRRSVTPGLVATRPRRVRCRAACRAKERPTSPPERLGAQGLHPRLAPREAVSVGVRLQRRNHRQNGRAFLAGLTSRENWARRPERAPCEGPLPSRDNARYRIRGPVTPPECSGLEPCANTQEIPPETRATSGGPTLCTAGAAEEP